jgi:glutaredoxin
MKDKQKQYQSALVDLVSQIHNQQYAEDYQVSLEDLPQITLDDINKWMCLKVFGVPEPTPDDDPVHG